jgi:hypothetical protein
MKWEQATAIPPLQFICGYCGHKVASNQGFCTRGNIESYQGFVYFCPNCTRPTYSHDHTQVPGVVPGNNVDYLPQDIKSLYNEARKATSVGASTAAVLACRKLLMNIAVAHGAKSCDTFVSYIEHLAQAGFVPPNGRIWVDHIRKKGNEATHEITVMNSADAAELIAFAEMLLKFVFEFPGRVPQSPK